MAEVPGERQVENGRWKLERGTERIDQIEGDRQAARRSGGNARPHDAAEGNPDPRQRRSVQADHERSEQMTAVMTCPLCGLR